MKLVFNHLLLRMLDLATERLVLLDQQRDNIRMWCKSITDEKERHIRSAEFTIENLLRNKDYIQSVLSALEESKPSQLTAGQEAMVANVRKVFRWGLDEYKAVLEYATEVGFDRRIIEGLKKDQKISKTDEQNESEEQE